MTETFTENVIIDGVDNTDQLRVIGHSSQTAPLQTWETNSEDVVAQITGNGRFEIGNDLAGTPDGALIEVNHEIAGSSLSPVSAGWHTLGRITGALASVVTWVLHELHLEGTGSLSGVWTAMRARLTNDHTTTTGLETADLRAAEAQVVNNVGSEEDPVGQATGLRATVSNAATAYLTKAVGVAAGLAADTEGTITEAIAFEVLEPPSPAGDIDTLIGLKIPDLTQGDTNYAIQTGQGVVEFGDAVTAAAYKLSDSTILTLSSDAATVTQGYHAIAAQTSTTDNLATLNGGTGNLLVVLQADTGDTITVKHGTGNIFLNGGEDFVLTDNKTLLLFYDGTNWSDVAAGGLGSAINETIDDRVATLLQAGTNVSLTYDDGANTLTVAIPNENIDDRVAALLVEGANVDLTYDDGANTLTVAVPNENIDYRVAAFLVAGTGISLTHDDPGNTLTVALTDEAIDDRVAALLVEGANVVLTYDDGANTLTVAVPNENIDDRVAAFLVAGTGISLTHDDPGNTLTATVDSSVARLTATQTLTNKTLTEPTLTLKQSTTPAPTAEGDIQWDTDDNTIKVGNGSGTQIFTPDKLTTKGDLLTFGTAITRKAVGNNGQLLKANSSESDGLKWVEDIGRAYANAVINSEFAFWQRLSLTPTTLTSYSDDTYGPDQWYFLTQTASIQYQRTTGDTRSTYAGRLKQNQASAQRMGIAQPIEGIVAQAFRGQSVRLQARLNCSSSQPIRIAILEWTGTQDSITSDIVNDWTNSTYTPSNFFLSSNLTVVGVAAVTPSASTWTDISVTGSISSSCNNLILFIWTEGTAAQNVTLDISEVWFGNGTDAQVWYPKDSAVEQSLCFRFLRMLYSPNSVNLPIMWARASGTTAASGMYTPAIPFRATPTLVATAADWQVGGVDLTGLSLASSSPDTIIVSATVSSGLTTSDNPFLRGDAGGDRYLTLTAEL